MHVMVVEDLVAIILKVLMELMQILVIVLLEVELDHVEHQMHAMVVEDLEVIILKVLMELMQIQDQEVQDHLVQVEILGMTWMVVMDVADLEEIIHMDVQENLHLILEELLILEVDLLPEVVLDRVIHVLPVAEDYNAVMIIQDVVLVDREVKHNIVVEDYNVVMKILDVEYQDKVLEPDR